MSEPIAAVKLKNVLFECELHQKRINYALSKLKRFMPLKVAEYKCLNDEQVEALDQFLFRFSKLQDTIGQRLFPGILELGEEPVKTFTFLDLLNRLEQLNVIDSKEQWLTLRNLRNKLAHEYEDDPGGMTDALNFIYTSYPILTNIFSQARAYAVNKMTLTSKGSL